MVRLSLPPGVPGHARPAIAATASIAAPHVVRAVRHARAEAHVARSVRGDARHDAVLLPQAVHNLARVDAVHLAADEPGGQRLVARRPEPDAADAGEPVLQLRGAARASAAPRPPGRRARRGPRPPRAAPSGARRSGSRRASSARRAARPCGARPSIHAPYTRGSKDGMVGASRRQACGARPDEPGAARAEQPLVAAGGEHVHAEVGRRRVLDAEAVHAVDAQEDALALAPPAIGVRPRRRRSRAAAASRRSRSAPT